MASKITFTRGDLITHTFAIPATSWSAGGKLFFAAKPAIDDDNTDANAVIERSWDDGAVSDVTINGVAYKRYTCDFPPSSTNSIDSGGGTSLDYLGEFQFVPIDNDPMTFPADDNKLDCIVYFDVIRKIA